MKSTVRQSQISAENNAGRDINFNNVSPLLNPGIEKLVKACFEEIENSEIVAEFIKDLQFFSKRKADRDLERKLSDAGLDGDFYEDALFSKEGFAKFMEVVGRHASGQKILIAAFRHAYSMYNEKVKPKKDALTFDQQQEIFEEEIVVFLSANLTGLPEFYGRSEAVGLIYHLADLCFIDYCHV